MARFQYKSVTPAGEVVEGEMEAVSRVAVVERLRSQGHVPIRAEEGSSASHRPFWRLSLRKRRLRGREIANLTRELATLLQAGLTLDRALSMVLDFAAGDVAASTLGRVQERLRQGQSLADALEAEAFPDDYVGMVRAGEAGGALDQVLARLSETLERQLAIRENVRSALQYPILVLCMAGLSIVILLTAVIPEFTPLFADAGVALPLSTQIVVGLSNLFRAYWWLLGVLAIAGTVVVRRQLRDPVRRQAWDRRVLRIPLFGELIRKIEAARFSRTLGTLLANGVSALAALTMTQGALSNSAIAAAVEQVRSQLKKGEGLAEPLRDAAVLPALAVQLIKVGEESGQLEQMLLRVADIYDEEVKRTIQRMLGLLVPAITIGLGVMVAFIVGSMLAAIMSTYDLPL